MSDAERESERLDAAFRGLREWVTSGRAMPGEEPPVMESAAEARILEQLQRHTAANARTAAGGTGADGTAAPPAPSARAGWPVEPGAPPVDRRLGE